MVKILGCLPSGEGSIPSIFANSRGGVDSGISALQADGEGANPSLCTMCSKGVGSDMYACQA